jgi:[ribosomal protein S5]-alanine N-acetyltransferase
MDFILRPWKTADLDNLISCANNFNIAKNMTDQFPHPYTISKGEHFIQTVSNQSPLHVFAIDVNSEAVGGIGIHPQTDILACRTFLG